MFNVCSVLIMLWIHVNSLRKGDQLSHVFCVYFPLSSLVFSNCFKTNQEINQEKRCVQHREKECNKVDLTKRKEKNLLWKRCCRSYLFDCQFATDARHYLS